ncbi:hypothetical protein B7G68_03425 [Caulobacter segnis]|jgi:hypothetical protein|uniref:Uncharacterized protein n=2 Tax=Caulobacter segnis TaxID=88688 RepID=D5VEN8_CAUST|nr:hypothetical protein [Caulobacter segnis]ADG09181.1 conserved hypothetical protein [Caulobacter segnis ATCC 21756]AVQ00996.1 hypothetical protein B7G68_03425 [Caulobacter segnis]MDR6627521.1 hypothetical protein [Caulobacter segnis]
MIPADGTALDLAVRRLERAVSQLEQRLAAKAAETKRALAAATAAGGGAVAPGLFEEDEKAQLVADLEAAREREKALEEAGEQASVALGRAIAEIRAALGEDGAANDLHAPNDDDDLFEDSEEA